MRRSALYLITWLAVLLSGCATPELIPVAPFPPTWTAFPPTLTRTVIPSPPTPTRAATSIPPTPTHIATPIPPTATHTVTPLPSSATKTPPPPPTATAQAVSPPRADVLAPGVWRCPLETANAAFVGSIESDKYHYKSCSSASRIKGENRICFASVDAARAFGYVPCGRCKPP